MAWRAGRTGTGLRRVGTARDPARGGSTPAEGRYPPFVPTYAIFGVRAKILLLPAAPSHRRGSLTKSLRMSRRGMGGKRLCTARASRGGAHGRAWVRVRASWRAVQGSWCAHAAVDHRDLLEIDGDGRRTERFFSALWQTSRVFQFSFFGKTAAWGRLVGRQRVQIRSHIPI